MYLAVSAPRTQFGTVPTGVTPSSHVLYGAHISPVHRPRILQLINVLLGVITAALPTSGGGRTDQICDTIVGISKLLSHCSYGRLPSRACSNIHLALGIAYWLLLLSTPA